MENSETILRKISFSEQFCQMEEEEIAKSKKFSISGVVIDVGIDNHQKPYDILVKTEKGKRYCCKICATLLKKGVSLKTDIKVLLLCSRIKEGIIHVSKIMEDTEKNRAAFDEYILKHNLELLEKKEIESRKREESKELTFGLPKEFDYIPDALKNNILDQMGAPEYYDVDVPVPYEMNRDDYRLKYRLCKNTYPASTRSSIERLLSSHHKRADEMLKIAMINTRYHPEKTTAIEARKILDEKVFGMETAKNKICAAIATSKRCNGRGVKILIVAPSGCGKTFFANVIAELRKKPSFSVPCGSLNSLLDLSGDDSCYDASKTGAIGQNFYLIQTTDATVIFEGIDRVPKTFGKDGDPNNAYKDMLGNGFYYDVFSGCKVDCRSTWFIATATGEKDINPSIRDCFDLVIKIDEYSDDEKLQIARKYIIPEICQKWNEDDGIDYISESALKQIIRLYCLDDGCHDLRRNIETLYNYAFENNIDFKQKSLSVAEVDTILDYEELHTNPIFVYKQNKSLFSDSDQKTIERLIKEASVVNDTTGLKDVAINKLKCIANIYRERSVKCEFDLQKFNDDVDKSHYGLDELKRTFARAINHSLKTGRAANILIISPPGVGKTTLAMSVAESINYPHAFISCNGINDSGYIVGVPSHVHSGNYGCISNALSNTGRDAVIILDEFDKINTNHAQGYGVISSFLNLLGLKEYTDSYLGVTINCSNVIFVATANHAELIPEELLDRFEVIYLEGYSKSEKKKIFNEKVLPALLEEVNITSGDIQFSDDSIDFMIDNYTETAGVRELKTNGKKIISDILLEHEQYLVDVDDVIKVLGKPSIKRGNIPTMNEPGIVNGLSVNSSSGLGNVFAIETIHHSENKLTGLAKECLSESVELARFVAGTLNSDCKSKKYFTHFSEGAVPKDGPSAGLATTVSILSCEYGISVNSTYAFTGEIDLFGNVFAVGGVKQKIEAAIENGCTKVFIPQQNYEHMIEELSQYDKRITIVPVSHVNVVCNELFETNTKSL